MSQDFWVAIEAVAVSLSFVVATFAYVADKRRQAVEIKRERLLSWQTGVIHKLFQKLGDSTISFDQIAEKYKIEATTVPEDIDNDALSDDALRSILFRFVKDRIVNPRGSDLYRLVTDKAEEDRSEIAKLLTGSSFLSKGGTDLNTLMATRLEFETSQNKITAAIIGILVEEQDKYTHNDIIVRIARQLNVSNEHVRDALNLMIASNKVYIGNENRLRLTKPV